MVLLLGLSPVVLGPDFNAWGAEWGYWPCWAWGALLLGKIFQILLANRRGQGRTFWFLMERSGSSQILLLLATAGLYLVWSVLGWLALGASPWSWTVILKDAALLLGPLLFFRLEKPDAAILREGMLALGMGSTAVLIYALFFSAEGGKAAPVPFSPNANYFSALLSLVLPFWVWQWTKAPRTQSRPAPIRQLLYTFYLPALVFMLFLLGIVWFQSRGAWLGLIGGVILGLWFYLRTGLQKGLLVGAVVVGAVAFWMWGPVKAGAPRTLIGQLRSISDVEANFSNRERIMRWRAAWRMAWASPFWGYGPGQFSPTFKFFLKEESEVEQISYWHGWRGQAHSEWFTRLAERGWVAALAFLGFWSYVLWTLGRLVRRRVYSRKWGLLLGASLGSWLVHGCFNDLSNEIPISMGIYWIASIILGQAGHQSAVSAAEPAPAGSEPAG